MTVTFGETALSAETLKQLFAHAEGEKGKFSWGSNFFTWSSGLTISSGAVLSLNLPDEMMNAIIGELVARKTLPYRPRAAAMMFYSWFPSSSIAWHCDYADKNSMTVYLNEEWHPDYGGCFCWRDWDANFPKGSGLPPVESRMRMPRFNNFVYMTESEWHTTTITSPYAPARLSLQMFFDKP